jgi:hypothetical protein
MTRLFELASPGCDCGHCRHLPTEPPAEGGHIITGIVDGVSRRFWMPDGGPLTVAVPGERFSLTHATRGK